MYQITRITQDAKQTQNLTLPDSTTIKFTLYYIDSLNCWYIKELTYKTKTFYNLKLVSGKNILSQYKNIIPFGLYCKTNLQRDPYLIDDFTNNFFQLFILSKAEVDALDS